MKHCFSFKKIIKKKMKAKFADGDFMQELIGEINDKIDSNTRSMVISNNARKCQYEDSKQKKKLKKTRKLKKIQEIKKDLIKKMKVSHSEK